MKKQSSKETDMKSLELLHKIAKVPVRESLYEEIKARVHADTIPLFQLRAVAAVFLCLLSLEIYYTSTLTSDTVSSDLENYVSLTDNSFYNE